MSSSHSSRLHRTALEHLGVRGYPKFSGRRGVQVWVPIEARPDVRRDPAPWVEQLSRTVAGVAGDHIVSGAWEKAGAGAGRAPARLHTERDQQNAGRAPTSVSRRSAAAPVFDCRSLGTTSTIPISAATTGPSVTRLDRLDDVGDLMAPMLNDAQRLPGLRVNERHVGTAGHQSYSADPRTQRNDWMSIMSRG